MAKISMAKAAQMFSVSRPTLAEHLKSGKITGEKQGDTWKLDVSELQRVYPYRDVKAKATDTGAVAKFSDNLSAPAPPATWELESKIKVLEAQLNAEKEARALVQSHLDDLRNRLPGPDDLPKGRRRWWQW